MQISNENLKAIGTKFFLPYVYSVAPYVGDPEEWLTVGPPHLELSEAEEIRCQEASTVDAMSTPKPPSELSLGSVFASFIAGS